MKYIKSLLFVALVCWITYSCSNGKNIRKTKHGGKVSAQVEDIRAKGGFKQLFAIPEATPTAANKTGNIAKTTLPLTVLETAEVKESLLAAEPDNFTMTLPIDGKIVNLLLYKVDVGITTLLLTDKDTVGTPITTRFINYRGKVDGPDTSIASITLSFLGGIGGIVHTKDGKYNIGNVAGDLSGNSVIYKDTTTVPFSCGADTLQEVPNKIQNRYSTSMTADATTKCVNWYWEIDYDLFLNKGSLAAAVQFAQELFAVNATLYANDGITIQLHTLKVWTSVDPYTGPATSSYLYQFGDQMELQGGVAGCDFNHLIGLQGNGGIAWIGSMCSAPRYECAYSGIQPFVNPLPIYSWAANVTAHEAGHNLGSRHTHDCVWNGNGTAIDSCGPARGYGGGCVVGGGNIALPYGIGGTLMSYCHLVGGVGMNLANGFGPQPSATMIYNINNSSCLQPCDGPPPPPNNPPVADAGDDKTITTSSTTLTGSGTDDVAVTFSQWGYVSGTPTPTVSGSGNVANVTGLQTGVYRFSFMVQDGGGLIDRDTMQLTVNIVGPPPPPPSGPIFSDNFNRTVLENGWTSVKGGWQLSNNELNNTSSTAAQENILIQQTFYDTAQADFAGVDMNTGPKFGIVLCYQSIGNYYLLYRNTGGTSQFRISKFVNGIETILKTKNTSNPVKNQFFKLRGRKIGNILYLDFNGVNQASISDNTFAATGATGVFINAKGFKHRVDNFTAQ